MATDAARIQPRLDYPPGAIIRNRRRLWRVDDVQGEVLTATSFDGAQADQGRFYTPIEQIQPGRITPPQSTHIDSCQSQDLLLAAFRLALIHGAAPPTIRLEARSSDLLTVTMLHPKV